jgi:hypothetical protein
MKWENSEPGEREQAQATEKRQPSAGTIPCGQGLERQNSVTADLCRRRDAESPVPLPDRDRSRVPVAALIATPRAGKTAAERRKSVFAAAGTLFVAARSELPQTSPPAGLRPSLGLQKPVSGPSEARTRARARISHDFPWRSYIQSVAAEAEAVLPGGRELFPPPAPASPAGDRATSPTCSRLSPKVWVSYAPARRPCSSSETNDRKPRSAGFPRGCREKELESCAPCAGARSLGGVWAAWSGVRPRRRLCGGCGA